MFDIIYWGFGTFILLICCFCLFYSSSFKKNSFSNSLSNLFFFSFSFFSLTTIFLSSNPVPFSKPDIPFSYYNFKPSWIFSHPSFIYTFFISFSNTCLSCLLFSLARASLPLCLANYYCCLYTFSFCAFWIFFFVVYSEACLNASPFNCFCLSSSSETT
jgi:hypothetical protein